jgi:two-component system, LytTR family, sensor kinase
LGPTGSGLGPVREPRFQGIALAGGVRCTVGPTMSGRRSPNAPRPSRDARRSGGSIFPSLGRARADGLGTPSRQAVSDVLALANTAASSLRAGLTAAAVSEAAEPLRVLLEADALAITDTTTVLGWAGDGDHHRHFALQTAQLPLGTGETDVRTASCDVAGCVLRETVVAAIVVDQRTIGTVQAWVSGADLALIRATAEVARWVSTQLELGELERSRAEVAGAQLRALRAQISPHFVFNALNTIASFVRTDPERARELLIEFADFARYSFSTTAQFTTLAEELRAIDTYVMIERARFGDRLTVQLRIAPEVLGVRVPFLVLQPLVENALRHGLAGRPTGTLRVLADDAGAEVIVIIEDDGVGMDPMFLAAQLEGTGDPNRTGVVNVDERLRTVYGSEYGLVIETNLGAGTKVTVRLPKFALIGTM